MSGVGKSPQSSLEVVEMSDVGKSPQSSREEVAMSGVSEVSTVVMGPEAP
jgi:hypothetical protein